MEIRSSSNYIWNIKDILGQGATGAVYKGRNKRTGDVFAIKAFNQIGMMRPQDVRKREFEVLRKLNHDNIVRIFDTETEARTRNEIIVMELCSGGSLFTLLEHPSKAHGFSEDQFKQVVRDVVAGMEHLREQRIVHRNLKPENIMRFFKEDGSSLYKLTDFGAARELEPQEQFVSIYGTEEYLHPELYERGVLRNQGSNAFDASVDLWSIGVTFYHIATGELPFRPFGGRQNRDTMYRLMTEKKSRMISGVQRTLGGEIEWSDKLPELTRLSQSLQDLITPVLAGVLESDPSKMMSFDSFFGSVQDIMSRKVVDVYCVASSTFHKLYIKPDETFAKLQELVALHTGVTAAQQRFFYKYDEFKPGPMAPVSSYPNTSNDEPLLVTGGEQVSPQTITRKKIPDVPEMQEEFALDTDSSTAKIMTTASYCSKRAVKIYVRSVKAMRQTAESVLLTLKKKMMLLLPFCEEVDTLYNSVGNNSSMCFQSQEHKLNMVELLLSKVPEDQKELRNKLQQDMNTIRSMIDTKRKSLEKLAKTGECLEKSRNLITEVLEKGTLSEFLLSFSSVSEYDSLFVEVGTYTKKIEDIYNQLRRDKRHGQLPCLDEENHIFHRKKIVEVWQKVSSKVEQCVKKRAEFHGQLQAWLSEVKGQEDEAERLQQCLITMMEAAHVHQQSLKALNAIAKERDETRRAKYRRIISQFSRDQLNCLSANQPKDERTFRLQMQCENGCDAIIEQVKCCKLSDPHAAETHTPIQTTDKSFQDDRNKGFLLSLWNKARVESQMPSGFDSGIFLADLGFKYQCPICLQGFKDPVQTLCGHRFCRRCIYTSFSRYREVCPVCNDELSEDKLHEDKALKNEMSVLDVRCLNEVHCCSCTWRGALGDYQEHHMKCASPKN